MRSSQLVHKKGAILSHGRFGAVVQRKCACGQHPADGQCEECKKKTQSLQRSATSWGGPSVAPPIVHEVLRSPGEPLDAPTRAFFEPRFGHDFSGVRVHTGEQAVESARAVGAVAYTVGDDVVFGSGQYAPRANRGLRLLAHELTHVVQQSRSREALQSYAISAEHHSSEQEAESASEAVMGGRRVQVNTGSGDMKLQRHKDDIVAYTGSQSGFFHVISAGKLIFSARGVSGHPGHGQNEPSVGPVPDGAYVIHPGIVQPPVSTNQIGTCGAAPISAGFQEITSTDPEPCTGAHFCNVPCPIPANPGRVCFTPRDCWGPMRIKIEGSKAVVTPGGERKIRDGFYIHGGNPADAVSSGCAKSLDNGVFPEIRKLTGVKGAVPFCVGTGCPPSVDAAVKQAVVEEIAGAVKSVSETLGRVFGF